ncbi:hypothetical protein SAMD00079811_82080 (plasmid) [Scytonema sp. HK-05]|nr:hypothetical protein SAMD00079811_82080 [Scytonema sp. HK-05]
MELALRVMLPPPPTPLKTLVAMSLSPNRRMSFAVMVMAPPEERSAVVVISPLVALKSLATLILMLPAFP